MSGVLLALSFPKYGHPAVAFIALVPLLVALRGASPRRGFILGLIAGFIHYAGTVYWTGATVSTFGGLPVFVGGAGRGTARALHGRLHRGLRRDHGDPHPPLSRSPDLWLAPAVWVSMEYLRGILIGGFPWIPLGNTMVTFLPIAQLASLVGVQGLSLFVAVAERRLRGGGDLDRAPTQRIAAATSIAADRRRVDCGAALRLASNTLTQGAPIRVGLIQGNIAQTDKWNPARAGMILDRYLQLSQQAVEQGRAVPDLAGVVDAVLLRGGSRRRASCAAWCASCGVPLLLGSDESEAGDPPQNYNAAFMLDPAGATAAVYRKIHLVPFGEYVPFQRLLFFVGPLVEAVSAFSPGTRVTMLPVEGHMVSTAICYEVTYPSLQREAVRAGQRDADDDHQRRVVRRVVGGVSSISRWRRCARSSRAGISCAPRTPASAASSIPYGRVLIRTSLFETAAVVGEARFVQAKTVYATIGDLAAQLSAAVVVVALAFALSKRH